MNKQICHSFLYTTNEQQVLNGSVYFFLASNSVSMPDALNLTQKNKFINKKQIGIEVLLCVKFTKPGFLRLHPHLKFNTHNLSGGPEQQEAWNVDFGFLLCSVIVDLLGARKNVENCAAVDRMMKNLNSPNFKSKFALICPQRQSCKFWPTKI